jgi:hypothetical protein
MLLFGSLVCGCATLEMPEKETKLPTPLLPPDSVRLEIDFVRVRSEWNSVLPELWQSVDEQHFDPDVRRHLADNGLRCGVIGNQLPMILRELLNTEKPTLEQIASGLDPDESHVFANSREILSSAGRPHKIVAAPRIREQTVLLVKEQNRVRAMDFAQAQGLFSLKTEPLGDGRVRLQLTPTVEYGDRRNRIVPGQGSFLIDAARESKQFDLLRVAAVLSPGETLVLSATTDIKGIGGWYFGNAQGDRIRAVMLVRLAQTQSDNLFSTAGTNRPLATPLD